VVIFEAKTRLNFGSIRGNRSLNRSQILVFEKFQDPDPDSIIFKLKWSRSLKSGSSHLCFREITQPRTLFGRGQSPTSSECLQLFCTKIISMSQLNFWSITTGCDVKYLALVSINKFWQAYICFSNDHYRPDVDETVFNERYSVIVIVTATHLLT